MISVLPNLLSERSALNIKVYTTIRVVVAEPDAVSRRVICSVLDGEADLSFQCINSSDIVATIQDFSPDLVIVDTQNVAIRRASSWETFRRKITTRNYCDVLR